MLHENKFDYFSYPLL